MTSQPPPSPGQPQTGPPVCYRHPGREAHIRCQRCGRAICPDCMRDASVGFQCPECVAQGAKQTRSGRTAYGGMRPTNASITSITLIGINVAVWLAILVTGGSGSRLVDYLALRPRGYCSFGGGRGNFLEGADCTARGGASLPGVSDGAYWQLLTSAFTHVDLLHIGFNMFALYLLGPQLELALGRARFLALYLVSGLAGSALVYWASSEFQATLGASGAIFGLFGALLIITLKVGGDVRQILILLGVNAFITFTVPRISWEGHVGGLVCGALLAAVVVYAPRGPRRAALQVAGIALVSVLVVASIAARSLALA